MELYMKMCTVNSLFIKTKTTTISDMECNSPVDIYASTYINSAMPSVT